jgi:hypothetical protein
MNLERFEPILKECGLENYFITMDLDLKLHKEPKDFAPTTAYPSATLLARLHRSPQAGSSVSLSRLKCQFITNLVTLRALRTL